ncbi:MAG TPA: hypothetical protein VG722_11800, partial [Tepidisphaeraceae bacterium]|nr:hypothetical protein [Tepidisphaeraceae bacterium]
MPDYEWFAIKPAGTWLLLAEEFVDESFCEVSELLLQLHETADIINKAPTARITKERIILPPFPLNSIAIFYSHNRGCRKCMAP